MCGLLRGERNGLDESSVRHVDLRNRVGFAFRYVAELTVRRQVEVSGKCSGLERRVHATVLEVEERNEIVARYVDCRLLFIGQHDQTVAGALGEPGDRPGDGHLPRIDSDGLDLIVRKVV